MRSARMVLKKWFVQEHAFLHRAYNALIDCFVITIPSLAFFRPVPLRLRPDLVCRIWRRAEQ
jgi:hypothetical protein